MKLLRVDLRNTLNSMAFLKHSSKLNNIFTHSKYIFEYFLIFF